MAIGGKSWIEGIPEKSRLYYKDKDKPGFPLSSLGKPIRREVCNEIFQFLILYVGEQFII